VYAVRESTVRAVYRLDQDDPRLHVAFDVDWFQRGTPESGVPNLRLALPLALAEASARYEIPFGAVDRETPPDQEVPALRWARIAGRSGDAPASLLLVNDCKHGHALAGSTLRVNLIRSSYDPDPLPEIGRHAMAFALLTSAGDLSAAEATRQAQTFVSPLLPVATGGHGGRLAPSGSLLRLQTEGEVVVSGLKMAEKGDGLVVRLYNAGGEPASATVATDPAMGHVSEARFVDLMERASRREGPPRVSRRGASFEVPAFGLASVWLRVRGATRSRR
jgi:alpha-mannosidase